MLLSVLIVNFRTGSMTSECVASFKRSLQGCEHEIIVIDNRSEDDSVETLRRDHPDIKVIDASANRGYGAAINLGAGLAAGDYLVISNSDILAGEAFADQLERFYRDQGVGILGIRLTRPDGSVQPSYGYFPSPLEIVLSEISPLNRIRHRHFNLYAATDVAHPRTRQVDWVTGALMFISRTNFNRIGGFDERFFMYYEDVDFSRRARDLGLATFFVAECSAVHRHCGTSAALPKLDYNIHKVEERRSALLYLEKHHPRQLRTVAALLEANFGWTLAGLSLKYYALAFSASRRKRNRYKVETYRRLVALARNARRAGTTWVSS
ncbi:MAG TPA: glycosyltransferase family 2 protein [bacterium]|nr:glycosyltransferase family 2 protein [bacterium]